MGSTLMRGSFGAEKRTSEIARLTGARSPRRRGPSKNSPPVLSCATTTDRTCLHLFRGWAGTALSRQTTHTRWSAADRGEHRQAAGPVAKAV